VTSDGAAADASLGIVEDDSAVTVVFDNDLELVLAYRNRIAQRHIDSELVRAGRCGIRDAAGNSRIIQGVGNTL
jgi:hypothetical protein